MDELNKQVRRARRWMGLERFVRALGWCCFFTLLAALALIVVDRFRPLGVVWWVWPAAAVGLGLVAALVWAAVRGRGPLNAAIEIDRRFGLKERVSSTLAMTPDERKTDVGRTVVADARRRVRKLDLREHFRFTPGRQILLPLVPLVPAVLVALLVAPAVVEPARQADAAAVKKQVKNAADTLQRKLIQQRKQAREEGLKDAQRLFQRLTEETENLADRSRGDRKQALVKLNDLSRQMQNRRKQLGGAEGIQKQLDKLKTATRGPADRLVQSLAQGNLKQAAKELERLKSKLAKGDLSSQDREKLARQLDEMKKKLEEMVQQQKRQEQELQNRIKQARQAGQEDEANRLQDQLNQMMERRPQMNNLQNLAAKLGQCSRSLQDGQLQDAGKALDQLQADLDGMAQQLEEMELLDDAMDQLCQARDQMNCPFCGGVGCEACQGEGLGAGRGKGDRPEQETEVGFFDTKVKQKVGRGSATIAGEVAGPNVRGNVQQTLQQQIESARSEANDPLTDQQMPRRHRRHAEEYFNRFRQGK